MPLGSQIYEFESLCLARRPNVQRGILRRVLGLDLRAGTANDNRLCKPSWLLALFTVASGPGLASNSTPCSCMCACAQCAHARHFAKPLSLDEGGGRSWLAYCPLGASGYHGSGE